MLSELTVLTDHERTVGNLQRSLHILKSRQEPQYLYCCRDFYLRFMSSLAMFDSTGRLPKQGMLSDTFPVVGPQVLFVITIGFTLHILKKGKTPERFGCE